MSDSDSESRATIQNESNSRSGRSITSIVKWTALIVVLLIFGLMALGLWIAITAAETWAPLVQIVRDTLIVILVLESILIATALTILMLQAAGFIIMLKTEIKPSLDNARETTRMTKATAEFVSKNSADPLIQIKSFIVGLLTFLREIIRIRTLLQTEAKKEFDPDGVG